MWRRVWRCVSSTYQTCVCVETYARVCGTNVGHESYITKGFNEDMRT